MPIALSVAMVFQSMPATALAAETTAETAVEETTDEMSSDEVEGTTDEMSSDEVEGTTDEMPSDEVVEDGGTDDAGTGQTEETVTEETTGNESTVEDLASETEKQTAEESSTVEKTENDEISYTEVEEDTLPVVGESGEEVSEEILKAADNSEAALATVIKVKTADLVDAINGKENVTYDAETKTVVAVYDKDDTNLFESVVGKNFADFGKYISIEVDNEDKTGDLKNHLAYKWQQKNPAGEGQEVSYTDLSGSVPMDAGEYRLMVTITAAENACQDAEAAVDFRIDKRRVTINYDEKVAPGTTVNDVKEDVLANYELSYTKKSKEGGNGTVILNKDVYANAEKTAAAINIIKVKDSKSEVMANGEELLDKTADYLIEFNVVFSDEKNYEIDNNCMNIQMTDEITTVIKVVSNITDGTIPGKVYDEKTIDEEKIKETFKSIEVYEAVADDNLKPEEETGNKQYEIATDDDGNEKLIKDAEKLLTYTWLDADKNEIKAENVKDAGTYYYKITYPGEAGHYAPAEYNIKVVIETAQIAIKPELDGTAYYEGMTVEEALRTVKDYTLYPMGEDGKPDETKTIKPGEYFWGTSYNETEKTQSYEPVFVVEKGVTDKEGKTTWTQLEKKDKLEKKDNVSYKIIFSGRKAVYSYNGAIEDLPGINASQENYRVDLSDEILEKYAQLLTITAADVTVDVTGMLDASTNAGESFDNPQIHVYDNTPIFSTRDQYKKAKVKGKDASGKDFEASGSDARIQYIWQKLKDDSDGYKDEYDEEGNPVINAETGKINRIPDEDAWEDYFYYGYNANVENYSTPRDAGNYRVKVAYKGDDATPATEGYVYYTIQKKNVQVELTSIFDNNKIPTYIDTPISLFLEEVEYYYTTEAISHTILGGSVTANADGSFTFVPDEKQSAFIGEQWREDLYYTLDWYVERLIKEGPDQGKYVSVSGNDTFLEGETYRLAVKISYEPYWDYVDGLDYYPVFSPENYNNCYELDKHNNKLGRIAYENVSLEIEPKETQGIDLNFAVDWSKITTTTKVYDGEPLNVDAVKEAVTVTNAKDGSVIPNDKVDIVYGLLWANDQWSDRNDYGRIGYVTMDNAIHAGTYTLTLEVMENGEYNHKLYQFDKEGDKVFTIKPKDLTVTPVLKEDVKAGTCVNDGTWNRISSAEGPKVEGYVKADEGFFENDGMMRVVEDEKGNIIFKVSEVFDDGLNLSVYEQTGEKVSGYLRSSKTYHVSYNGKLEMPDEEAELPYTYYIENKNDNTYVVFCPFDYNPVFETVSFTPVHDTAFARSSETRKETISTENVSDTKNAIPRVKIRDDITGDAASGYVHTITPLEGIQYTQKALYDEKQKKLLSGNYFVLEVEAPIEYTNDMEAYKNVIYESSIKDADGYIISDAPNGNRAKYQIAFDASAKDTKEFDIVWENGYSEKFKVDFTKAALLEDLTKAVAPKSLAFNAASKKMFVGESQQLDLKITKKQMSDIICILYETDPVDSKILEVSETGYVTALSTGGAKTGKATVLAYPAYEDEDGIKHKIENAKPAKLPITVSELPAVKNIKVEPHDTYAYLTYAQPAGGYRREIYVLEGKKTVQNFEDTIAGVKNGNYKDSFVYCKFDANEDFKAYQSKNAYFAFKLEGLEPGKDKEYTVYVRNVSALRTMADGDQIAPSHAGAVKTFKTTKAQITGLEGYFDYDERANVSAPVVTGPSQKNADDRILGVANVNISAKKVQFYVDGKYFQKYSQSYSDEKDYIRRQLPLAKADQATYISPKLTYYVTNQIGYSSLSASGYVSLQTNSGVLCFNPKTERASIDKKGRISLKGVGQIYVIAYDSETKEYTVKELLITAGADSLTGKNIKLKVGDTVKLSEYLTYKQGKTKLPGYTMSYWAYDGMNDEEEHSWYNWVDLSIDRESDDSLEFSPLYGYIYDAPNVNEKRKVVVDYQITAKQPINGKVTINVTDNGVAANGGKPAKITITSGAIDPVKSLKTKDVVDKYGYITFSYGKSNIDNDFETQIDGKRLAFRIVVTDASGKQVFNKLVKRSTNNYHEYPYLQDENENKHLDYLGTSYNSKKKVYDYVYLIKDLTRLSNYTVTVTAVYGEYESKPAKTRMKTTNIPASYWDVSSAEEGGTSVLVGIRKSKETDTRNTELVGLSEYPILKSGNTYTLSLPLNDYMDSAFASNNSLLSGLYQNISNFVYNNPEAAAMKTDVLTWKSSNPKVATVKATAGTYSAILKAVKKGTTEISVTSKITKKVIARWTVIVNAVGEADGYYGDNVPDKFAFDDTANQDVLGADVLTLNNPLNVVLGKGEDKWVVFTAPAYGEYTISVNDSHKFFAFDSNLKRNGNLMSSFGSRRMEKGETWYFRIIDDNEKYYNIKEDNVRSTVTVKMTATGVEYNTVAMNADGTKVKAGDWIHFVAPEGNYYTFTYEKDGSVVGNMTTTEALEKGKPCDKQVKGISGSEYVLKVSKAEPIAKAADVSVAFGADGGDLWYSFTAEESGRYTLSVNGAEKELTATYYNSLNGKPTEKTTNKTVSEDGKTTTFDAKFDALDLKKGDRIYIKLHSETANKATLRIDQAQTLKLDVPADVKALKDNETTYVTFQAPSDGTYRFNGSYEKADGLSVSLKKDGGANAKTVDNDVLELELEKGGYVVIAVSISKKDTSVSVVVTKTETAKLTVGSEKSLTVSKDRKERAAFTAAEDGWYNFGFDITEKSEGETTPEVKVDAKESNKADAKIIWSQSGNNDFSYSEYLNAGQVRTLYLSGASDEEVEVKVSVTKEVVEKLTNGTITLKAGEVKRYIWTATKEGLYEFSGKVTSDAGSVKVGMNEKLSALSEEAAKQSYSKDAESLSGQNGYKTNGEAFYLIVKAGDDVAKDSEVKYEVKISDTMTATPLAVGQEATTEAGTTKWFEFTAKETALYEYCVTSEDAAFSITKHGSLSDDDDKIEIKDNTYDSYRVGQRRFFKITNNSADKKTVKLSIAKVVPTEVTLDKAGTVSFKAGQSKWFTFKANEAGRYRFEAKAELKDKTPICSIIGYTSDLLGELTEKGGTVVDNYVIKNPGAMVYFCVKADLAGATPDDSISVTLSATKISGTKLEKEADVAFKEAGTTNYLEFTATEDGMYTFTTTDKDGKTAGGLTVGYYINLNTYKNTGSANFSLKLKKDDKVIIEFTSTTVQTVKVKVQKETLNQLTTDAKEYTIEPGKALWFAAKTSEPSNRYFIEAFGVTKDVKLNVSNLIGVYSQSPQYPIGNLSGNGFYYSLVGRSAGEVLFKLTADNKEADASFKIRMGIVGPAEIKTGETKEIKVSETEPNHMTWFCFTPKEAGRYITKAGGEPTARVIQFTDKITASTGALSTLPSEVFVSDADIGKKFIFAVYYTTKNEKTSDLKFSVHKAVETTLTESEAVTVDPATIEAGEKVYVSFKAPCDGRYVFTHDSTAAPDKGSYKEIDKNTSASSAIMFNWDSEKVLKEGDEVKFWLSYSGTLEKAFHVSVHSVAPQSVSLKKEDADKSATVEFKADNTVKWLVFEAAETAEYKFAIAGDKVSVNTYEALDSEKILSTDKTFTRTLDIGKKLYLRLEVTGLSGEQTASVDVTVTKETELIQLTTAKSEIKDIAASDKKWAYFTADEAGFYTFEAVGKATVYVYSDMNSSSVMTLNDKGKLEKRGLAKGETLYFSAVNNEAEAITENIQITKTADVKILTAGAQADKQTLTKEDEAWYIFTAAEKGTYRISAGENAVLTGRKELNGSNSFNSNVPYLATFDKGDTMYFRVTVSSQTEIAVTCAKLTERTYQGVKKDIRLTLNSGSPVLVKWTSDIDGIYNFGFDASQQIRYMYIDSLSMSSSQETSVDARDSWEDRTKYTNDGFCLLLEAIEDGTEVTISMEMQEEILPIKEVYEGTWKLDNGNSYGKISVDDHSVKKLDCTSLRKGSYKLSTSTSSIVIDLYRDDELEASGKSVTFEYDPDAAADISIKVHGGKYQVVQGQLYCSYERWHTTQELVLNSSPMQVDVEEGCEAWLTFTVPKDGIYKFEGSCDGEENQGLWYASVDVNGRYYTTKSLWGTTIRLKYEFKQGDIVVLKTRGGYSECNAISYTLGVSEDSELEEIDKENFQISSSYSNSRYIDAMINDVCVWTCTFGNNAKNGEYRFYSDNENILLELYDSEDNLLESGSKFVYEYKVPENDDYTELILKAHHAKYQAVSGNIYAEYVRDHTIDNLTLQNNSKKVQVAKDAEAWFTFTVPKAGIYKFEAVTESVPDGINTYGIMAEGYVGNKCVFSTNNDDKNFRIKYDFSEGDVVTLKTYGYQHQAASYTVIVSASSAEREEVDYGIWTLGKENRNYRYTGLYYGDVAVFTCAFPEDMNGIYHFYVDSQGAFQFELYEDDKEVYIGDSFEYKVDTSKTVRVKVALKEGYLSAFNNLYAEYIWPYEEEGILTLEEGKASKEVTVQAGGEAWIRFAVPENGSYRFKASGDSIPYGKLYVNDNVYTQGNMGYSLTAWGCNTGDEILLKVYQDGHNNEEAISCTITVEKEDN